MDICEAKLFIHAVKLAHRLWFVDPWYNSGSNVQNLDECLVLVILPSFLRWKYFAICEIIRVMLFWHWKWLLIFSADTQEGLSSDAQLCLTLCDRLGSPVHSILLARILEWGAMPSSRESFQPGDRTYLSYVSCFGRWALHHWHRLRGPIGRPALCQICVGYREYSRGTGEISGISSPSPNTMLAFSKTDLPTQGKKIDFLCS